MNILLLGRKPLITTIFTGLNILSSLLVTTKTLSMYQLNLNWYMIRTSHQYYRFFTCVLATDEFSIPFVIMMFQMTRQLAKMEIERYATNKKELCLMLAYIWISCIIAGSFPIIRSLNQVFFNILTYISCKKSPDQLFMLELFQFIFPARYLFILYLVVGYLNSRSLLAICLSMFFGHVYWFVDDVLPVISNVDIVRKILRQQPKTDDQ